MNLEEAIEWAEKRSNVNMNYHVTPWNDKYAVISDTELLRHPDTITVYNTKEKMVNYEVISELNSISKNDSKSTYICVESYIGGPCEGELIELSGDHYKYINEFGMEVKYHKNNIKVDDRFRKYENINISRKSKLNGRLRKLFT